MPRLTHEEADKKIMEALERRIQVPRLKALLGAVKKPTVTPRRGV